jgi:photosystem II stability/assembly factor-like uncharacterized protein
MRITSRVSLILVIICVASGSGSCTSCKQKNSNQSNTNGNFSKVVRWVAQYRSPESARYTGNELYENFFYSSIAVVSPSIICVAGDMHNPKNKDDRVGVFVRTTDGGQTWSEKVLEQPNVADIRLNGICFVNADTGWTVGRDSVGDGIMFKTTDGGQTWTFTRLQEFSQVPTCIYFADAETGWMGGGSPREGDDEGAGGASDILGTTDGGRTWQSQIKLSVSIFDLSFVDKQTGWASGSAGAIYHTTDGGRTWNAQRSEIELGDGPVLPGAEGLKMFNVTGIHFIDAQYGYAAAGAEEESTGRILGTANGGAVWAKQRIIADAVARDILFVNPSEGWTLVEGGQYIYHTVDGNRTWLSERVDFEQMVPLVKLGAADAQHVWAVGGGAIFVRLNE